MGKRGNECRKILNELGVRDILCLDSYKYDYSEVYPLSREDNWYSNALYVITAENRALCLEIRTELKKHINESQIEELFSYKKWIKRYGKVNLDFLVVGFPKCGTTSLQSLFMKNTKVFLPEIKETFFAKYIQYPAAHRNFKLFYSKDLMEGKLLRGGVEPSYFAEAETVREYFGNELKVLFCVRNPVEAADSLFRMHMRDAHDCAFGYFDKHKKISPDVFEDWVKTENAKDTFLYMDYIKEYLKYYPQNQIKIILLEDIVQSSNRMMRDVQEFIGLDQKNMVEYKSVPCTNKGQRVLKDLAGAYIIKNIRQLITDTTDINLKMSLKKYKYLMTQMVTEEYHQEMHKNTKCYLFDFYKDSIYELENLLNRSLKGIWYN